MPEAFPEQSVQEGKRAGYIVYLPGIVVALIVAGVSYYQTGNYQQVKIWQQATAQAPALLDRALDPKADPLNEEEMSRLALGMRTQHHLPRGNGFAKSLLLKGIKRIHA